MSTRAVEQVDDWDTRPFSGGYRGLHELADDRFSGIVTAGPTRLCMTKGTVVGVLDGSIESFEGASGTVHEAPSPALPLLAVMQEADTEVRAQYYTEETPIREVDGTLSDGNFTGYIELSENVLSGDYYVVYHQGRSMSVAYVGNAKQLLTEDEAFQRANDEVGIYEVIDAEIEVVEIPEPADGTASSDAGADEATAGAATAAEAADTDTADATDGPGASAESVSGPETGSRGDDTGSGQAGDSSTASAGGGATTDRAETAGERGTDTTADEPANSRTGTDRRSSGNSRSRTETADEPTGRSDRRDDSDRGGTGREERPSRGEGAGDAGRGGRSDASRDASRSDETASSRQGGASDRRNRTDTGSRGGGGSARRDTSSGQSGGAPAGGSRRQGGGAPDRGAETGAVGDLETRSIPSVDPSLTSEPDTETAGSAGGAAAASGSATQQPDPEPRGNTPRGGGTREPQQGTGGSRGTAGEPPRETPDQGGPGPAEPAEIDRLESELDEREAEIDRLESELDERDGRIEELETRLEEVRAERDDLQDRIENLEDRIDDLRTEEGGESIADRRRMSPGEAIDGTNLFIRYASKGEATLENAHDGSSTREDVNANLEIQHHTQFDADDVAVDGDPFEEYLEGTMQYRFVEWVVRVLPYEIRDTGHEGALKDLYDAMPRIDRAELNGAISVVYEDEGEEQRSQESFDVVLRDRMGNPLAVANMNESRDPASQGMMEGLITAARRVCESKESLAGAVLVTSSFFAPEAMEAASQATGGGLLSRDKRESFVKLSRKDGFHLCLVEAREAQFNLSVPEI